LQGPTTSNSSGTASKDYIKAREKIVPYEEHRLLAVEVSGDAANPLRHVQELDLSRLTDEQLETLRPILVALAEFFRGFLPCWVHTPLLWVKTQAAPVFELSLKPAHDGSVAVGRQRDGVALVGESNRAGADQLRPLLRELRQR
jgi:hypothetical protein